MRPRPDLLAPDAPDGVEIFQITQGELPSSHVYMEAQVFMPDSKRFLLHESAAPHGSDKDDPRHRYLLCDIEDDCSLRPMTEEVGATAPSVSPDGGMIYYFVNETEPGGGRLTLKQVRIEGTERQTLFVLDTPIPGTSFRPSRLYPLSTIRADSGRIALSCFLGDGRSESAPWGLMVFDLENPAVELILQGESWCNVHPQYCRSTDPDHIRDLLVQENHGNIRAPDGGLVRLTGGSGADIHVIRDDGTRFRDLPWGRDSNEFCQGHQCWRGTSAWAITSTSTRDPEEQQLIESRPVSHTGHVGIASPGGERNDLSRDYPHPCFHHFSTDSSGARLITDAWPESRRGMVIMASLGRAGVDPLREWTPLACPGSTMTKDAHLHPFLSPDGRSGFFNSDESGVLQAYMIRGLPAMGSDR